MRFIALITAIIIAILNMTITQAQTQDSPPVTEPEAETELEAPNGTELKEFETVTDVPTDTAEPKSLLPETIPSPEPIENDDVASDTKTQINDMSPPLTDGPDFSSLSVSDLSQLLSNNPNFSQLADAIGKADLNDTFQGEGSFTIFAPTNAAFENLPSEKLEMLHQPENKDMLSKVLSYHVVLGAINSATLLDNIETEGGNYNIETLGGGFLTAILAEGDIYLLDMGSRIAKIELADIKASNGIIHAINSVALPKPKHD